MIGINCVFVGISDSHCVLVGISISQWPSSVLLSCMSAIGVACITACHS